MNKRMLIISFFIIISFFTTICNAAEFSDYTTKYKLTYVVPYGKEIKILKSDGETVISDNNNIAQIVDNKLQIIGLGKFTLTVKKNGKEEKVKFFAWNVCLKKGKYYTYNDVNRDSKSNVLYSKTFLAVSATQNDRAFKVEDYFYKGGKYKGDNLIGKYITSYYNKKNNNSTNQNYKYSMINNFSKIEPVNNNNNSGTPTTPTPTPTPTPSPTPTPTPSNSNNNNSSTNKPTIKPVYKYPVSGKVKKSYKDDTIVVSVEIIDNFYVSKIWVKNPSSQVRKKQSSEKTLVRTRTVNEILNSTANAIIGCNASSYSTSLKGNIDKPNGNIIITNGVIKRQWANKKADVILGMLQDGSLKYYRSSPYSDLIKDGVKNTFKFGPILIDNGVASSKNEPHQRPNRDAERCCIGQIDSNNYVILSSIKDCKTAAAQKLGLKLGCRILYNADGGGSTTLWFRGKTSGKGTQIKSSSRKLPDTLYFVTEAKK